MAHQVVIGYSSKSSKYVDVEGDISPTCSGARSDSSLSPNESADSVDWASLICGPNMSLDTVSVDMASSISTAYC